MGKTKIKVSAFAHMILYITDFFLCKETLTQQSVRIQSYHTEAILFANDKHTEKETGQTILFTIAKQQQQKKPLE